jgi:nucleoside-diphosphate-sugar epimerase
MTVEGRRVLVTGAAGFIGMHTARALLDAGAEVVGIDNFEPYYDVALKEARLATLAGRERFRFARVDLADAAATAELFRTERCSHVVHLAAQPGVRYSLVAPEAYVRNNLSAFGHVLEGCRHNGVEHLVYASSSSVYGDRPDLPKREDQPVAPLSPYAASKAAGEQYAAVWTRLYGVETVGLRYFNVFGPRQDPKSEYAAVIPRFILWGLRGRPLEVHGDGTQSRDFTYIDNVVSANLLAAKAPGVRGEVFNVGCGSRVSLLEIIARLEAIVGRCLERRHTPSRAGDVPHTLADVSKGKRLLGYEPLVDFDEGFRRTVEHFQSSSKN